jgi:predicted component of type VI protein secretion system
LIFPRGCRASFAVVVFLQSAFQPLGSVAIIPDDWDVDLPGANPRRRPARPPQAAAAASAKREHRPQAPAAAPSAEAPSDAAVVEAFLRGVALNDATLSEPEKTLERIGAALRASVNGLRQTLMARAASRTSSASSRR